MRTLRLTSLLGIFLGIAMMTIMMAAAPPPAFGEETYTWLMSGGTNYWDESSNWNPSGPPTSADNAIIDNGGTAISREDHDDAANYIYLGYTGSGEGTLWLTGGTLSAYVYRVGFEGTGYFLHSGGTLEATFVEVGVNSGSFGQYEFTNGTEDIATMYIGYGTGSDGVFYMVGSTCALTANHIRLGEYGAGSFELYDGEATVNNQVMIGNKTGSFGEFTHSGGTLQLSGGLDLAFSEGSVGNYYLMLTGILDTTGGYENIGAGGTGSFSQEGGTHQADYIEIGYTETSEGTYTQSGGTTRITTTLIVAGAGTGTYALSGTGVLDTTGGTEVINGSGGVGRFTQSGGTHIADSITIKGPNVGSSGTYDLTGGRLIADTITVGPVVFGTADFNFTGGTLTVNTFDGDLTVGSNGTLSPGLPIGLTTITGGFVNSGTILLELGGTGTPGTDYDAVAVDSGDVTLNGILRLAPYGAYTDPSRGDYFDVLSWNNAYSFSDGYAIDDGFASGHFMASIVGTDTKSLRLTFYEDLYWNVESGSWVIDSNWDPVAVPQSEDNVYIDNSGTANVITEAEANVVTIGNGTVNINSGGTLNAASIANSGGTSILNVNGGALNLSGGTIDVTSFGVGSGAGATGSFTLEDGKTLIVAAGEGIGAQGTGSFTQSGGTHQADHISVGNMSNGCGTYTQTGGTVIVNTTLSYIIVGNNPGSSGTYDMSGGALSVYNLCLGNAGTGVFMQSGGSITVTGDGLDVGANGAGFESTYTQTAGTLNVNSNLRVGRNGIGIFSQSGGKTTATNLYIGFNSIGSGTYELSGTGALSAANEYVGNYGTGMLAQSGGTNTAGNLVVGYYSGSAGTYDLSAGKLIVTGSYLDVGVGGIGTFKQSGTADVSIPSLFLADGPDAEGVYEMSGGTLSASAQEYVGYRGSGSFAQTGGTNTGSTLIYVAYGTGSTGSYEISGGAISATRMDVGYFGNGYFEQSATADIDISGTLNVASLAPAVGTYDMLGGTLNAAQENIGGGSAGVFTQSDGTNTAPTMIVGYTSGSSGSYNQTGGTVVSSSLIHIGYETGSSGSYDMSGGVIDAYRIDVGYRGEGYFMQSAEAGVSIDTQLNVGSQSSGAGTYDMQGGTLGAATEAIGNSGAGAFQQTGGTNEMATLYISYNSGAAGTYTQSGGTTKVTAALYAGYTTGAVGTYELSGTGVLDASLGAALKNEYIGYGSGSAGAFIQSSGTNQMGYIYLGYYSGSAGTYTQSGGTAKIGTGFYIGYNSMSSGMYELSDTGVLDAAAKVEYIGYSGTGSFTQEGGTNQAASVYLGYNANSRGMYEQSGGMAKLTGSLYLGNNASVISTYELSGDGVLEAGNQYVGYYGTGVFKQSGGTSQAGNMDIGMYNGSRGLYQQSGGTTKVTLDLSIGFIAGSIGTYELSGTGVLTATTAGVSERVGRSGTGVFVQTGGTNEANFLKIGESGAGLYAQSGGTVKVAGAIQVGANGGSIGTYELSGTGFIDAAGKNEEIGYGGTGAFIQSGGTNQMASLYLGHIGSSARGSYDQTGGFTRVTSLLYMGFGAGISSTYELEGAGVLDATGATEHIGYGGTGTFTQTGGTHVAGNITMGSYSGSSGTYTFNGGVLTDGVSDSNLFLGNHVNAHATFQGYGTVDMSGTLTNNGRIIADGEGVARTLDMSAFASITNTVDNPTTGGINGWFAVDKGKLVLQTLDIAEDPGDVTYWWGENISDVDGRPDLVNSIKLIFHNVTEAGTLDISLLAKDHPDTEKDLTVYDTMGVWKFEPSLSLEFDSVDLVFRYDDSFGYSLDDMVLYRYHDGIWYTTNSSFDEPTKVIDVTGVTGFSQFQGYGPVKPPTGGGGVIPEPVTVLSFIAGMAMLGFRRLIKRK